MIETMQLLSTLEASKWATDYIGKNVTPVLNRSEKDKAVIQKRYFI
jgi:hypothetical protein